MYFGKLALTTLALFAASAAHAQIYMTPIGSTTLGGSVNATANFMLTAGHVKVILTDLQQNPTADSQLISGLTFTVSGATSSGALTSANAGKISTISSNGSYTAGTNSTLTRWKATEIGTSIALTTLSGGTPNSLIIGPDSKGDLDPTLGGLYSHANPSITNNHNPSVLGSATFDITVTGITSASVLSNVVFDFGTESNASNTVVGSRFTTPNTPEPGSVALLLGMTVSGVGLLARRRKAVKAA